MTNPGEPAGARPATIDRGDVFWVGPDDSRGPVPSYSHPHVVVQDDRFIGALPFPSWCAAFDRVGVLCEVSGASGLNHVVPRAWSPECYVKSTQTGGQGRQASRGTRSMHAGARRASCSLTQKLIRLGPRAAQRSRDVVDAPEDGQLDDVGPLAFVHAP